jgi:hypothetical protein
VITVTSLAPSRRESICPTDVDEHLATGTFDPVGYALVQDALSHAGLASAARISTAVCSEVVSPPVDPLTAPANFAMVGLEAADQVVTYPHTAAEPALASYVYR